MSISIKREVHHAIDPRKGSYLGSNLVPKKIPFLITDETVKNCACPTNGIGSVKA
jgi:hypothetical protein